MALKVTREAARRFLVRRSGLGRLAGEAPRRPEPGDALEAVRALEYVQVDPMCVLERNHDLVLAARVGGYRPEVLDRLLYQDRSLVEVMGANRYIIPVEDYPLFRLRFQATEQKHRPGLGELEPVMEKVLGHIREEGALSSLDIEDNRKISGWWDPDGETGTRAVRQALEWLWHFGRVVISRREGSRRFFDLPERLFGEAAAPGPYRPGGGPGEDEAEELRGGLARKYLRAMGLSDPRDWSFGWAGLKASEKKALVERLETAGEIAPVTVEGVKTHYYVPAAEAGDLAGAEGWEPEPEVRFLPPLDNLIWLRRRLSEIFGFDYAWEAYTPAGKRRYGPYTCPILWGERLVGRIDARVDRGKGNPAGTWTLVVNGLWWEGSALSPRIFLPALESWAAFNGAAAVSDPNGVLPAVR